MANASNYLRSQVGDQWLNGNTVAAPADMYIGLYTDSLAQDGTGTEVTGGSYARKQVSIDSFTDDGVGGFTLNVQLEFVDATANWGTIVSLGVWDASSAGNLIVFDDLQATKTIESGDTFRFNIGAIVINIS